MSVPKGDPEFAMGRTMDPRVVEATAEAIVRRLMGNRIPVQHMVRDPFEVEVRQLREEEAECTDGGGEDHFMALVALGECPYCGTQAPLVKRK